MTLFYENNSKYLLKKNEYELKKKINTPMVANKRHFELK